MTSPKHFGVPEGIGQRLAYWANQLSRDKSLPWVGLGLIADLKCAAKLHGVDFDEMFPLEFIAPAPVVEEEDEFASFVPASQDFDL